MRKLRASIKISSVAPKHRIKDLVKLKKIAMSNNRSHLFDTRPLKREGLNKLRNHLGPLPFKALVAIVGGEECPKGTRLTHLEPIIRFLLTELGWREGQPSVQPLVHVEESMETSQLTPSQSNFISTQNNPIDPAAINVTKDLSGDQTSEENQVNFGAESQQEFLKTQHQPKDHSAASNETKIDGNGNNSLSHTQVIAFLDSLPSKCDVCEEICDDESDLKKHKETHENEIEETKTGKKRETSEKSDDLSVAQIATRSSQEIVENPSPMPGCSKDSDDSNNSFNRRFKCQNCEKSLGAEDIVNHQCEEKSFSCSECDKEFSYEKDLKNHESTHKGKLFECSKCDQTFKRSSELKNHEKIHTEKEPFTCVDCGDEFMPGDIKFKGKLSRCPECHKKFRSDPANKPVCEFYKAGHCKYGPQAGPE